MRTENLKKLITANVTSANYTSSSYTHTLTPLSGSFIRVNGTTRATMNPFILSNSADNAVTLGYLDILYAMVPRRSVKYLAWSTVLAGEYSPGGILQTRVSATYDPDNQPITSEDYALRGTDVPASVTLQNNGTITVTFSNSGDAVMHANRIGFSVPLYSHDYSELAQFGLMHIFAFDDIALAPGETKSITIRPDTD